MKKGWVIIFLLFILQGCVDTYRAFQNEVILSELQDINYESNGYRKISIGPYSFYMPERLEREYELFTKINAKIKEDGFSNTLTIEYSDGPHFIDVPYFSITEQPIIKKTVGLDSSYISPPDFCDQRLYITNETYWLFCPRRDFMKLDYYLSEKGKYILQLTVRASSLDLTQMDIRYILKSFRVSK